MALSSIRQAVRSELQRHVQKIYAGFSGAFEYPSFLPEDQFRSEDSHTRVGDESVDSEPSEEEKAEQRGQAESLQFVTLRNKLRQTAKTLLLALSAGSNARQSSSKLD